MNCKLEHSGHYNGVKKIAILEYIDGEVKIRRIMGYGLLLPSSQPIWFIQQDFLIL